MGILFSLIKNVLSNKPTSSEIRAIELLSSVQTSLLMEEASHASTEQDFRIAVAHHQAGRLHDAEAAYRTILQVQPFHPDANYNLGALYLQANQPQTALPFFQTALGVNPSNGLYRLSLAECQVQLRAWDEAGALLCDAEEKGLKHPVVAKLMGQIAAGIDHDKHIQAAKNRFPGHNYLDWLKWLHLTVKPANYVEIGVETGQSLQFSRCKAVGIDPLIQIIHSQESWVKLFKLTSDDFFAQHDLGQVLEAEFVDMAFIDGLHTFDQALKDFINIERYAHSGTVVAFHDIFPVTALTASRERKSIFWVGDTWKVIPILKELRPDLKICTLPAYPSGLALVTGLDGNSKLLSQELEQIIERWMEVELDSYLPEIHNHLNVINNDVSTASRFFGF